MAAQAAAPLTAADFGDSVSTVSGVSGVPGPSGVFGVAPGPKSSTPPGTLNWGTSTALEVALQVMVLCT